MTEQLSRDRAVDKVRPGAWARPYLLASDGTPLLAAADNPLGCFDGDRSVGLVVLREGGPVSNRCRSGSSVTSPKVTRWVVLTRATARRVGVGIGDGFAVAGWCTGDGDPVGCQSRSIWS